MVFKISWFATLPLRDHHDVMARIGFRLIWCTLSYLMLVTSMEWYGIRRPAHFRIQDLCFFALPIIGGVIDEVRLLARTYRG